jgi:hypothetical protein
MAHRIVAFSLAAGAFLLAVGYGILLAVCGGSATGGPNDAPTCLAVFHPFVPAWAFFALLGALGLWFHRAWPAIALGSVGIALGLLALASAGYAGIGSGALLLAGGLVGREPKGHAVSSA